MARQNAFKETFGKTNQTVIEHGISKTFHSNKKLNKKELEDLKQTLEDYRKDCFKRIYETNPDKMVHSIPINNYILIKGEYCTWHEELLNQLPIEMISSFANLCDKYNETL